MFPLTCTIGVSRVRMSVLLVCASCGLMPAAQPQAWALQAQHQMVRGISGDVNWYESPSAIKGQGAVLFVLLQVVLMWLQVLSKRGVCIYMGLPLVVCWAQAQSSSLMG